MTALQQKYSKDRARLRQEMLALYKAESVSPFAGIGPALLQTPVLVVMAAVAEVSRRRMRSEASAGGASTAAGSPGPGPAAGALQSPALAQVLQWLPYIVLVSAVFVPLAAALYLMTTTAWTAVERPLLRRMLGWTEPRHGTDSGFTPRPAG
ncbi:MAG: YidC/Oxa1 family membrane protein insertase [Actinomycetota bacterium]|nr:YidC/Oxa1 family membrane protein insertase [Actinomycetota bacterium]